MIRDKKGFNVVYVHVALSALSKTERDAAKLEMNAEVKKTKALSKAELGVNTKDGGSEAVIKLVGVKDVKAWIAARGWAGKVIRIYDEAEHKLVLALVKAASWEPPDPQIKAG